MRDQTGCWITHKRKLADAGEIARWIVGEIQVVAAVYGFPSDAAIRIKRDGSGTVDRSRPDQARLCATRISIANIYAAGIGGLTEQAGASIVG